MTMRMVKGWLLGLGVGLAVTVACADVGRFAGPGGTATPGPTAPAAKVDETSVIFSRAVGRLQQAKSYRFTIQAVHHWRTPDGKEYDWPYEGEGTVINPDQFYSVMRGPADTLMVVKMQGGKILNTDARGERPEASTAFGGPGVGAAPFTVISYLKIGSPTEKVQATSLDGAETYSVAFTPSLSQVASLDAFHGSLRDKIQAVQGNLWIDKKTGEARQETVTVKSLDSRGLPQTVTITLRFFDYDKPAEIR